MTRQVGEAGRAAFVVLAGGSGTRVGAGLNKVYLPLAGRRVISWSFVWAAAVAEIGHFLLVTRAADAELARRTLREEVAPLVGGLDVEVVPGGTTRHGSEQAALDHLRPRIESGAVDVVAIHDGARPLATPDLVRAVVRAAREAGGALPGLPATDVLPVDDDGLPLPGVVLDPAAVVRVQTPQAFRARDLLAAYVAAAEAGYAGTDTASSIEAFSDLAVRVVPGSPHNLKVTYPHDLLLAERLLRQRPVDDRPGTCGLWTAGRDARYAPVAWTGDLVTGLSGHRPGHTGRTAAAGDPHTTEGTR